MVLVHSVGCVSLFLAQWEGNVFFCVGGYYLSALLGFVKGDGFSSSAFLIKLFLPCQCTSFTTSPLLLKLQVATHKQSKLFVSHIVLIVFHTARNEVFLLHIHLYLPVIGRIRSDAVHENKTNT